MSSKRPGGQGKSKRDKIDTQDEVVVDGVEVLGTLKTDPIPTVFVNKAHLGEIKSGLDEVVKKYAEELSFTPSLLHPTVHLTLGYTSCFFSLGAALYGLRVDFEESKPALWIGVIGYAVLQSLLWCWKRWVEQGEIFRGKRRRMVKRIETDHIYITTSTNHLPPPDRAVTFSPLTRPSSPSSPSSSPISPANLSPSMSADNLSPNHDASTSTSSTKVMSKDASVRDDADRGPTYVVHISLITTSNNGKSLLQKARVVAGRGIGRFIDESGGIEEGEIKRWLAGLFVEAGIIGREEGTKEE